MPNTVSRCPSTISTASPRQRGRPARDGRRLGRPDRVGDRPRAGAVRGGGHGPRGTSGGWKPARCPRRPAGPRARTRRAGAGAWRRAGGQRCPRRPCLAPSPAPQPPGMWPPPLVARLPALHAAGGAGCATSRAVCQLKLAGPGVEQGSEAGGAAVPTALASCCRGVRGGGGLAARAGRAAGWHSRGGGAVHGRLARWQDPALGLQGGHTSSPPVLFGCSLQSRSST